MFQKSISKKLKKIILANEDIFAEKDTELGRTDTIKMKINTGDDPPIRLKPYRTPLNQRPIVEKAVKEMLDADIIRKSQSPWSAPIVLIRKKDNSIRFCIDYRKINQITKINSYPLAHIDDILNLLGKARYFSNYDLKSGYWQLAMDPVDREKTAFTCHKGLFEFNVMPFGLTNAPAVFSELMAVVLDGLESFAIAYLDDILVFSSTLEEHLEHTQIVFDRLRKNGLKLKLKKNVVFCKKRQNI